MTTLVEIAKLAKVSRSTVSRVINNEPRVSDETRQRVWTVIRETDFRPNNMARALAGRQSHIINLVMLRPFDVVTSDPFSAALVQFIVAACEENGYQLMLSLASTSDPHKFS